MPPHRPLARALPHAGQLRRDVGGTVTLIGTSTNLVVSGLLEDAGQDGLGLFEIGAVGLPFAVAGVAMMIALTPLLLPDRRAPSETADEDAREFTVEMVVAGEPGVAGRSVAEGGLRDLQGMQGLASVEERTSAPWGRRSTGASTRPSSRRAPAWRAAA